MAVAQNATPSGFIGGGVSLNSTGLTNARTETDAVPLAWFVEGGGFVGSRVGIGAELYRAPTQTSHYSSSSGVLTQAYHETSVLGTIRVRLTPPGSVAFDVAGGAGIVFQRRDDFSGTNETPFGNPTTGTSAMVALGADLLVRVSQHFAIVPAARVYVSAADTLPGSVAPIGSSTTFGVRVSGRVVW